jgi:hypothetical protein
MAQIFISHSQRDEPVKNFFYRAFSGTAVLPIWMEYEDAATSSIDEVIERKIQASSAVFFLLSETVERISFTRDWVLWENGKISNKDIWVFEPEESFGRINVVLPRFHHYVRYQRNKPWRDYINSIVRSYDSSNLLGLAGTGAGLGAIVSEEDRAAGAIVGGLVGAVMEAIGRSNAPTGIPVTCLKCSFSYAVHLTRGVNQFRCARCNCILELRSQEFLSVNRIKWAY